MTDATNRRSRALRYRGYRSFGYPHDLGMRCSDWAHQDFVIREAWAR